MTTELKQKRVGFISLGCPKALVDSERILTQLRVEGYEVAPPEQNLNGPDDPGAFHLTFYPDRAPAGSTVLFGVEPQATTLLLVDEVPACLPLTVRTGPTG